MASYQIVRQIEQPGFLQGLGQGIPKGTDTFLEQMLPRIMKQRDAVASEEKATGERNAYIDALKKQGFEESDATVGKGGISRRFSKPKVAEPDTFLESSRKAAKGDLSFDALEELFPTEGKKIAEMQFQFSPLSQKVIKNIKGPGDIEDLRKNSEEYKKAGVDVDKILEFLKIPRVTEPPPSDRLGIIQKMLTGTLFGGGQ